MTGLVLAAVLAGDLDAAALRKLVEARRGRPVVVSFWATWCAPCVKEFPGLMDLAVKRPDVAFVSVSLDDTEDRGGVEAFVAGKRPPFPVYLKAAGGDDDFINAVDAAWSGVVPATLILDRKGQKSALLEGEHAAAQIEAALGKAGR